MDTFKFFCTLLIEPNISSFFYEKKVNKRLNSEKEYIFKTGIEQNRTAIICLQNKHFTVKLQPPLLMQVTAIGVEPTLSALSRPRFNRLS